MMLRWRVSADDELTRIGQEIAQHNPNAADNLEHRVHKFVQHLSEFPDAGRMGRVNGTRELVISDYPYIVVYRIKDGRIDVLGVRHAARQWPTEIA